MIEKTAADFYRLDGLPPNRMQSGVRVSALLRYVLIGYIFFLPVQFEVSETLRFAPSDFFLLCFLILGFFRIRFDRSVWSVFHVALLGIFILGTVRAAFDDPHLSNYVLINKDLGILLLYASYAMICTAVRKWTDIRWILRHFVIAVVFQTALASAAFFGVNGWGMDLPWINHGAVRLSGFLVDPNAFGGLVAVALLIHSVTYFSERPMIRGALGALCMFLLSAGLLLTLSRSAWIGFLVAGAVLVLIRPHFVARLSILGALAFLAVLVGLGNGKTQSMVALAERSNTVQARVDMAAQALPLISESPIFGIGIGAFNNRFGWIVHNTPLWMLTEFGLVGLSAYLCLCVWFFAMGLRAYRLAPFVERPVVLCLICAHLCMLGISVGIEALYQRHWWVVMALLASTVSAARNTRRISSGQRRESLQPVFDQIAGSRMNRVRTSAT